MSIKKVLKFLFILLFSLSVIGCGDLDPAKVDEKYVKEKLSKELKNQYGTEFNLNVISFNSTSEKRECVVEAYPKIDSSLKFQATGSIENDYFSASKVGTSYHWNYNFYSLLIDKINAKILPKYSLELIGVTNYNQLANNVRNYMKDFKDSLSAYKDGYSLSHYFSDKYDRADVPLSINGKVLGWRSDGIEIIIDKRNDKVVIDTSAGEYGWIGELEVAKYLELLATDKLHQYKCELHCKHYHQDEPCCCET